MDQGDHGDHGAGWWTRSTVVPLLHFADELQHGTGILSSKVSSGLHVVDCSCLESVALRRFYLNIDIRP